MNEKIYRKESLDKVKSPDNLNDYIRVSNPGVWLLLISVIVLFVGAFIWGIFGHVDSTVLTTIRVENGNAVCYVAKEDITSIAEDMTVKFENNEAVIESIGDISNDIYVCTLKAEAALPDGYYDGKIITKSYRPLSFIFN